MDKTDDGDNGPVILGVTWFLCAFSGVFLALRLYAKLSRHSRLWWDDYIIALAWVLLLVESAITQAGRGLGLGKHIWNVELEDAFVLTRNIYIGATVSCFAATLSKISFGITLLRLTQGPTKAFVWFCIIGLFIVMLPSAFLSWLSCRPTAKLYIPYLEGNCWPAQVTRDYGYFNAAFCTLVDFALALLPWKLLWGLQLQVKEKIGVGIAMSMGLLAGVCAIIKGVHLQDVTNVDFFYTGKDVTIWTVVEIATAIIGACIPVLRVFFKNTITSLYDRYHRTDGRSTATATTNFASHGSSSVPLEIVQSQKSMRTSISSVPGTEELGMVITDDSGRGHGGILQTNTVTVMHAPNPQGRIAEWRGAEVLSNYR
ncbi:hypothetical protein P171DRAFT_462846 [Karstenula rhodostoma CBS 690.94]|uniref:Rhodopsin domain-containing protein n=1 Tax=Karstenula rhodostoma CBS 690.94 TaxID=1392251 RepID=A0A9P4UDY8_9PLEO|nr:hypothetical protein P171DRAFT_462846 [Karstenula rhodostoma CBS 690.94]